MRGCVERPSEIAEIDKRVSKRGSRASDLSAWGAEIHRTGLSDQSSRKSQLLLRDLSFAQWSAMAHCVG